MAAHVPQIRLKDDVITTFANDLRDKFKEKFGEGALKTIKVLQDRQEPADAAVYLHWTSTEEAEKNWTELKNILSDFSADPEQLNLDVFSHR